MYQYITSESVCAGHPDKLCDKIADSILDEAIRIDKYARMAVEATIKDNFIFIYGESSVDGIDYGGIAKKVIEDVGYDEDYEVLIKVSKQSNEIANAVINPSSGKLGAGDQGIVYGYATDETPNYMPMPIYLAHAIAKKLDNPDYRYILGPDGKTQVTVAYNNKYKPADVHNILVSKQHRENVNIKELRDFLQYKLNFKSLMDELNLYSYFTNDLEYQGYAPAYIINPSGSFVVGGSFGDSGTTGRKIVVDTYGGVGRVGGGALSSKDPTKVDRSGAYYARYVAKNIVYNKLATRCEIQVAYGIGLSEPISFHLDCYGTNTEPINNIYSLIGDKFDFSPYNIIEELDLRRPIYADTAVYGHYGDPKYPWEQVKIIT